MWVNAQRIFIGLPIEEPRGSPVSQLLNPLRAITSPVRWVPEENRHLTLAFLGSMPKTQTDRLAHAFDQAFQRHSPIQLQFSELGRFPNPGSRVIALTCPLTEPLEGLLQTTRKLLDETGIRFEKRRFKPHITVGRIRRGKFDHPALHQEVDITLRISSVVLYQSTLTESGSIYQRLKETGL